MSTNLNTTPNLDEVIRELREIAMEDTDSSAEVAVNVPGFEHYHTEVADGYVIKFHYSKGNHNHPRGYYLSVNPGHIEDNPELGRITTINIMAGYRYLLNSAPLARKSKHGRNEALANLNKQIITNMIQACYQSAMN